MPYFIVFFYYRLRHILTTRGQQGHPALLTNTDHQTIANILQRPEFQSSENQIYQQTRYAVTPRRNRHGDIFYENQFISQSHAKNIQMRRRDMFFQSYQTTRGDYAVFTLLHHRASFRSLCRSALPARFSTQICLDQTCCETGPCLAYGSQQHLHNCNRYDYFILCN